LWAFGFWEGVVEQFLVVEVGFDGLEIGHDSYDDSCSVSCATVLKVFTDHNFQLFSQLDYDDERP
jgi:hypothetical protein